MLYLNCYCKDYPLSHCLHISFDFYLTSSLACCSRRYQTLKTLFALSDLYYFKFCIDHQTLMYSQCQPVSGLVILVSFSNKYPNFCPNNPSKLPKHLKKKKKLYNFFYHFITRNIIMLLKITTSNW